MHEGKVTMTTATIKRHHFNSKRHLIMNFCYRKQTDKRTKTYTHTQTWTKISRTAVERIVYFFHPFAFSCWSMPLVFDVVSIAMRVHLHAYHKYTEAVWSNSASVLIEYWTQTRNWCNSVRRQTYKFRANHILRL